VTRALPSGRNATPHGTSRFLAITLATTDWLAAPALLVADGEVDGVGSFGGEPCSSAEG
jgi:hypothetical protein